MRGAVPLNPPRLVRRLRQVSIDPRSRSAADWLIVLTLIAFAAFLALFIRAVVFHMAS